MRFNRGGVGLMVICVATLLSVVMPFWLVLSDPDVGPSPAWVICLAVLIWSGLRLAGIFAVGAVHLFDFFFLSFRLHLFRDRSNGADPLRIHQ